jgi:hypothetical protein
MGRLGFSTWRALSAPRTGRDASMSPGLEHDRPHVPVEVLVRDLALVELHDHHHRHLDAPVRRRHPGQDPVHTNGVGEAEHHLIDHPILAHRARYRHRLDVGRELVRKRFE